MDDELPVYEPAEALVLLKRNLRDLRAFTERGSGYRFPRLA